jgi:serine protease Do
MSTLTNRHEPIGGPPPNAPHSPTHTSHLSNLLGNPDTKLKETEEKTLSSSEISKNVSDNIYNTIVRIVVHEAEFDYELPFKIKGNRSASGTGFFIDAKGHIMTCSHVVQDASHVYVEIPSEGKRRFKANVLGICPFFDLAIIRIVDYQNTEYCELCNETDDEIKSGDETYALGFPLGQDNLKVTKGIISGQQHNMYQIDTPINHGNSGGPLIKNNLVIGVNGAGIMFANNIGYAVPISRYFLIKDLLYTKKRLIHYPEIFGFEYQRTSQDFIDFFGYSCGTSRETSRRKPSATQRNKLSHKRIVSKPHTPTTAATTAKNCGGVYVKRTFKNSPISGVRMKCGDIVCSINGSSIDNYGEFNQRWMNQKMDMSNMLCSLPLNKAVEVNFWSHANKTPCTKSFTLREYKIPIRHVYPEFEKDAVDYEVIGGMVVMQLTLDHCAYAFGRIRKYKKPEHRHEPRLVISSILQGSTLATSVTVKPTEIVEEINDIKVRTLAEFRKAIVKTIRKHGKTYVKLATEENNIAILSVDTIKKEENDLQSVYKYTPSPLLKHI